MAVINCPECGKEISDQAETCIHCGYPIKKKSARKQDLTGEESPAKRHSKKIIPVGIAIVIAVLGIVFFVCYQGNYLRKAKRFYQDGKLEEYTLIRDKMSEKEYSEFCEMLEVDIDKIQQDYYAESIDYDDAIATLEKIGSYVDRKELSNYSNVKSAVDNMHTSRKCFEKATASEAENNYVEAYNYYGRVVKEDANYTGAQEKRTELKSLIVSDYIERAKEYAGNNAYASAITELKKTQSYEEDNKEVDELLTEYKKKKEEIQKQKDQAEREKALLKSGDVIETDEVKATFKGANLTDYLYPDKKTGYYTYYSVNDDGRTMLDIVFRVKNLSSELLNLRELPNSVVATYDGSYKYENWDVYISQGNRVDRTYDYLNNSIDPLSEVTMHLVIDITSEAKNSGKPIEVTMNFAGEKHIIEVQ